MQLTSRRSLLKASAALAAPLVLTTPLRGAAAPSNRIAFGWIGTGRMGHGDMKDIIGNADIQIAAVCDVDSRRADDGRRAVEAEYARRTASGAYRGCDAYKDYRELCARGDIDAVMICTPEHWHALIALEAARTGKDIFVQKPMTYGIREGRVLSDTVRRHGRILQVGSQQRSEGRFRFACELVRNGRLGRIETVEVGLPLDPPNRLFPPQPIPSNLDYDFWLGPAPYHPYTEERVHPQKGYDRPGWLRVTEYCLGMITGWGAHHLDITQWGLNTEESGPTEISGTAEYPADGVHDVHGAYRIEYTYPGGVKVICSDKYRNGVRFVGSEGWVYVTRGFIESSPRSLLTTTFGPNETRLYVSNSHKRNLIDCIKTRRPTICPVETGHRSNTVCILGHIAMALGRTLRWDPVAEQFINDDEANRMIHRPYRGPWVL